MVAAIVFAAWATVAVTAWTAISVTTGTVAFAAQSAFATGCAFTLYVAFGFGLERAH